MTFGEKLKQLRAQSGLSQEGLARKADMSVSAVRQYEQGLREPYWYGVFQLSAALGVSSEVFRDCVGSAPEDRPAATEPAKKSKKGKKP